jgi:hypothetical protein
MVIKTTYEVALEYLKDGISVIPVYGNDSKVPAIKVPKEYARRPPTKEELKEWFYKTNRKIALVMGPISRSAEGGLWCADADDKQTVAKMEGWIEAGAIPPTCRVVITKRGKHYYFLNGTEYAISKARQIDNEFIHIDVKTGSFSFVIAPPSVRVYKEDPEDPDSRLITLVYAWEKEGPWENVSVYPVEEFYRFIDRQFPNSDAKKKYLPSQPLAQPKLGLLARIRRWIRGLLSRLAKVKGTSS